MTQRKKTHTPRVISVDYNAHEILLWAKEQLNKGGVAGATHSDAIRYLKIRHNWRKKSCQK